MKCLYFPFQIQKMVISGGNFKPESLKAKEELLLDDEEIEQNCNLKMFNLINSWHYIISIQIYLQIVNRMKKEATCPRRKCAARSRKRT